MMPPSLHDWLPEDHLARFVADLAPSLDLTAFYASYEEKDGRGQAAYHPVIAVDAEAQVIVAADITQEVNDKQQLAPMLEQVQQNTGAKPVAASADTGYCSTGQITDKRVEGIDLHVATERNKHGASSESVDAKTEPAEDASALEQMKQKLQSEAGRALYKMRKAIVEPVFGQITD